MANGWGYRPYSEWMTPELEEEIRASARGQRLVEEKVRAKFWGLQCAAFVGDSEEDQEQQK